MSFKASIEHLASIIRAGNGHTDPYAPYEVSITVRWLNPKSVEILGLDRPITGKIWRSLKELLLSIGVTTVRYERVKDGVSEWVSHNWADNKLTNKVSSEPDDPSSKPKEPQG